MRPFCIPRMQMPVHRRDLSYRAVRSSLLRRKPPSRLPVLIFSPRFCNAPATGRKKGARGAWAPPRRACTLPRGRAEPSPKTHRKHKTWSAFRHVSAAGRGSLVLPSTAPSGGARGCGGAVRPRQARDPRRAGPNTHQSRNCSTSTRGSREPGVRGRARTSLVADAVERRRV